VVLVLCKGEKEGCLTSRVPRVINGDSSICYFEFLGLFFHRD
jgi:hypothetical protein